MLKGLIALFSSGLIFNPALLLGALFGILSYIFLSEDKLPLLYKDYHLYMLFLLFCFVYVYFFKKTLKDDLKNTDWQATGKNIIKHFLLMSFSFVMGILFASFFDFSDLDMRAKKQDYKYSEISEMADMKKQAEDLMKTYNSMFDTIK